MRALYFQQELFGRKTLGWMPWWEVTTLQTEAYYHWLREQEVHFWEWWFTKARAQEVIP